MRCNTRRAQGSTQSFHAGISVRSLILMGHIHSIQCLCFSHPERVHRCIEAGGGRTLSHSPQARLFGLLFPKVKACGDEICLA